MSRYTFGVLVTYLPMMLVGASAGYCKTFDKNLDWVPVAVIVAMLCFFWGMMIQARVQGELKVAKHKKPNLIIVWDEDGEHINAVLQPPIGMNFETAMDIIYAAIDSARQANPEEWNYDEVYAILTPQGFQVIEYNEITE